MNKHIEIALIAMLLIVTVVSIAGDAWLAGPQFPRHSMNWRPGRIDERMMHRATLSVMTAAAVTDKRVPTASGRQHTPGNPPSTLLGGRTSLRQIGARKECGGLTLRLIGPTTTPPQCGVLLLAPAKV